MQLSSVKIDQTVDGATPGGGWGGEDLYVGSNGLY